MLADNTIGQIAEQVQTAAIDAAKITAPQRDAIAIEEIEDLDRHLAAILDTIAELRRGEPARIRGSVDIGDDRHHLRHGLAQEEMIMGHLVHSAHAAAELHEPAQLRLRYRQQSGNIADARRAKTLRPTQQRLDLAPQTFVRLSHRHLMAGQPHPGPVQNDLSRRHQLLKSSAESRHRQARLKLHAQPLHAQA
ncbi:hypothetical protein ATN84_16510 [Paramesorhizobium deserti]|uniref:Uncharacterized protein n=1 Tax=Paramesorhizobium deserti TaxID=1494590 RepID=A0A135HQX9_9HYPH|nr:hypothetical protein ATN84_16510 [Paramesorhizobium deserti]